jgi:hypothetical protein
LLDAGVDLAGDAYIEGSGGTAHDVGVACHFDPFELGGGKGLIGMGGVCGFGVLRLRCASLRMTRF